MNRSVFAVAVLVSLSAAAHAQEPRYDLLIRNGRVLSAKTGTDAVMDVAVAGGKIARLAAGIPAAEAKLVVDATGLLVTPGLVDIHVHVFHGTEKDAYLSNGLDALLPDGFGPRACTTTMADAGGAGWRNLPQFKEQVADRAATRVLSWINIVGSGMKGGPVEQNVTDMDATLTARRAKDYKSLVIGVKTAHFEGDFVAVERSVAAGRAADVPVMVDFGAHTPELSLEDLFSKHLRPGDVFTHAYARIEGRGKVVDAQGKVSPHVLAARQRGILFDVGHGGGSFVYAQAVPAIAQGFKPDIISTDLHTGSMNSGMKDIVNVMSKLLGLGLTVPEVVEKSTWAAARAIKRPELGNLDVGAEADIAVLSLREGRFGFTDVAGLRKAGSQKLECELTVRAGKVLWDLNGIAKAEFK
jgi:dihydroorotase